MGSAMLAMDVLTLILKINDEFPPAAKAVEREKTVKMALRKRIAKVKARAKTEVPLLHPEVVLLQPTMMWL